MRGFFHDHKIHVLLTFERVHDADVHDGADIGEVPLRDPEVERTEGFARHDPGSVLQVCKPNNNNNNNNNVYSIRRTIKTSNKFLILN